MQIETGSEFRMYNMGSIGMVGSTELLLYFNVNEQSEYLRVKQMLKTLTVSLFSRTRYHREFNLNRAMVHKIVESTV